MFYYHDKSEIDGGMILHAVLRTDMAPIPETLEIDVRLDGNNRALLKEGNDLYAGEGAARGYRIVLAKVSRRNQQQGIRQVETMSLTAVLKELHALTFVRETAVYLEDTTLTDIYRACGAELSADIKGDIRIPSFLCMVGDTPTFAIAKLFQEHGGVLRAKDGAIEFMRLETLFDQAASVFAPANVTEEIVSGFLERHEIPWFTSINDANGIILGNNTRPRHVRYVHRATEDVLRNMTRVLMQAKAVRIDFNLSTVAGSIAELSDESKYVVLTAAHVYSTGTDGQPVDQHTRVWLGELTGTETEGGGTVDWLGGASSATGAAGLDSGSPIGSVPTEIQDQMWAVLPAEPGDTRVRPTGPTLSYVANGTTWTYTGGLDLGLLDYYPRAISNPHYTGTVPLDVSANLLMPPQYDSGIGVWPVDPDASALDVRGVIPIVQLVGDTYVWRSYFPSGRIAIASVNATSLLPRAGPQLTATMEFLCKKAIFIDDAVDFVAWVNALNDSATGA